MVLVQKALVGEKIQRDGAEKLLQDAEARLQKEAEAERITAAADRDWAKAQLDALQPG